MKLSIIIPTYNVEKYIDECLTSLLPQLNDNCELIIIDDASNDETKSKIFGHLTQEMASKYFQYKDAEDYFKFYMNEENKGVSACRNIGLKVASGEYIAFIDSDDIVKDNYIKSIFKAIENQKDIYKISWESFEAFETTYFAKKLPEWNCAVWTTIWSKEVIKNEFDETLRKCEDEKFMNENVNNIKDKLSIGYIDEPIYKYRAGREGNLTNG